jgi:PTS system sucrose-specific IIC component
VIVITGIHHSFHAIEAGLLGNPSIGVNFLLPIWAMANVAQGGACLAVWFKTKDAKIKAITLPSAFSAMLGITEAAIFGINLRFVKPFIAALIGGAVGGAWVVSVHVHDRRRADRHSGHGHRAGQLAAELYYRHGDCLRRGVYRLTAAEI